LGTFRLLRILRGHWHNPVHPVYQFESRYIAPWQLPRVQRPIGWFVRAIGWLFALTTVITGLRFLLGWPILWTISNALILGLSVILFSLLTLIIIAFTFLWPIAIATITNNALIRERSTQTWTLLLTTPLAWKDIALAKIAAPLRWLAKIFDLILWFHLALVLITLAVAIEQIDRLSLTVSPPVAIVAALLVGVQFAVSRVQDYSSAVLIGMTSALVTRSTSMSLLLSVLGGIGLVAARLLISAILLLAIALPSPQNAILLLLTGPSTGYVLTLAGPALLIVLIGLPLAREITIRLGYRWVWDHLGTIE